MAWKNTFHGILMPKSWKKYLNCLCRTSTIGVGFMDEEEANHLEDRPDQASGLISGVFRKGGM